MTINENEMTWEMQTRERQEENRDGVKAVGTKLDQREFGSEDGDGQRLGSAESIKENLGDERGGEVMGNTRDGMPEMSKTNRE